MMLPHGSVYLRMLIALFMIGLANPVICFSEDEKPKFQGKLYFWSLMSDRTAREVGIADQDLGSLQGFFALDPNDWSWKQYFPLDPSQRPVRLAPDGRTLAAGRVLPSRKVELWLMDLNSENRGAIFREMVDQSHGHLIASL